MKEHAFLSEWYTAENIQAPNRNKGYKGKYESSYAAALYIHA